MSRYHRLFSIRVMLAPVIILLLVLSGCASHASGHPRGNQATTTASIGSSSPTATSIVVSSSQQTNTTCSANGGSPLTISKASVGRYADFGLDTWEQLPDTLALKPQILSQVAPVALGGINNTASIRVDVNAPPATQPAYVCGLTVRITSFQPLSGPAANVYHKCVDQAYQDPGGFIPSTACPGGPNPAGSGKVTFTSASVGAQATGAISGPSDPSQPAKEPSDVEPNASGPTELLVSVQVPQPGLYTFAVSLWQDSSGPSVTGPNVTAIFLFGQARHEWGGQPCTQPAMQPQLPPPTTPPTQVICPGGAPTVQ